MKIFYNKLVRDNIPEFLKAKGIAVNYVKISRHEEKLKLLKEKLLEESRELYEAKQEEIIGEVADVIEVILCLTKIYNVNLDLKLEHNIHDGNIDKIKNELLEESNKIINAKKQEVFTILQNIIIIVNGISIYYSLIDKQIITYRLQKVKERGSFNEGIFLISTEE